MKQKQGLDLAAVILLLLIACAALAVPVALLSPKWLIAPAVLIVAALGVLWYQRRRLRTFVAKNLCSTDFENSRIQYSLTGLPIPTMLIADGRVLWYNTIFREEVLNGTDAVTRPIDRLFPELDLAVCSRPHGQDLTVGNKRFTAYAGAAKGSRGANIVYLVDDTVYKQTLEEYTASRPACLIIVIDSYDELFDDMKDSEQAKELEAINSLLEAYIAKSTGFLRKISNSRYIAVVEERDIHWMLQERFEILDQVRALHPGGFTTLSIVVGHGGKTLQECHQMARESIDIALGRGGDQAVVKCGQKIQYYGGKAQQLEKTTRVKARVKAHALRELLETKDCLLIMGHKIGDIDCFGAAIGMYRIASALNKKAHIVINEVTSSVRPMMERFETGDYPKDLFLTGSEAADIVDNNTALVVVDVNRPSITEEPDLLKLVKTIVVIDHHRQSSEIITNATLSYVEPYASSACELVAEILQYVADSIRIKSPEADAMYAGIVIDTNNFTNQAGVRTFEAAAFLRRNGADVTRVRKLFRDSMEDYKARAEAVRQAEVYKKCFAISVCPSEGVESPTVVGAQAANELLDIVGMKASVVLTPYEGKIYISARSIDEVNVQVMMEKLGGGGHRTIAGAQLPGATVEEAKEKVKGVIDMMLEKGEI